jgi:hypothetical protein
MKGKEYQEPQNNFGKRFLSYGQKTVSLSFPIKFMKYKRKKMEA